MKSSCIPQSLLAACLVLGSASPALAERELHVVGIYEPADDGTPVSVHVNRPAQSVTLFLGAYDRTSWQVTVSSGTTIERVFLSGYYRQTVQGLPPTVPVTSLSYEDGTEYLSVGYSVASSRFLRAVPKIEALTGQEISSFHGGYQPPGGFVIDSVQNDPRLTSRHPQPVPLAELPNIEFDVATYSGQLTVRHYGLDGPDDGGPLLALGGVMDADAAGTFYYGGDNGLTEVNAGTGAARAIPLLPEIEREGWQMGTTYDRGRGRALLVTLAGEGFLYGYSPERTQWDFRASMQNRDFDCIEYHDADDSLYAVTTSHDDSHYAKIVKLSADGAFVKEIALPVFPFDISPWGHRAELVSAGDYLVLLLAPPRHPHAESLPESRIYLIDPRSSEVWLTYRQTGPPNQAPEVSLDRPNGRTTVPPGSTVHLAARAFDRDGSIAKVEFFVNGNSIGLGTFDPTRGAFTIDWTAPDNGSHTVVAEATDNRGATATSPPLTLLVDQPPTVQITAPVTGTTVALGASVVLTATAQDPDGSIVAVRFFVNGRAAGSGIRVPGTDTYSLTWQASAPGTATVRATATDNLGAVAESASIQLTVDGPTPPGTMTATRHLPPFYLPGRKLTVVITARPSADGPVRPAADAPAIVVPPLPPPPPESTYTVVDRVPAGWSVGGISRGGRFNAETGTVTFGPFSNDRPRVLFYRAIPPKAATGPQRFVGTVNVNGVPSPITGTEVIVNAQVRPRPQLPPVLLQGYE